MEIRQHALRNIALKLNVSGTAEVLEEQRLYKGSYGFVKLQVYVPKTQNTEAPILTAFCTTVDGLGREKISTHNHRLWYVEDVALGGFWYLLFEGLLPREFTEKATVPEGLKITFNYCDSIPIYDDDGDMLTDRNGVPRRYAANVLISSRYVTTVYEGGWNDESMELDINDAEAAQIDQNRRDIAELQADVRGFLQHVDGYRVQVEKAVEDTTKALRAAEEAREKAEGAQSEAMSARNDAFSAQRAAELARDEALEINEKTEAAMDDERERAEAEEEKIRKTAEAAIPSAEKGVPNGVATLGGDGKVPPSQLPSYVDDVLEYASLEAFPPKGESDKIYIAKDVNMSYRWTGTTYVEVGSSLAIGETDRTAYAGSKGKKNAEDIAELQEKVSSLEQKEEAGFGDPTAKAKALSPGAEPTVSVTASGPKSKKVFAFDFGIPRGDPYYTFSIAEGDLIVKTASDASPNVDHSIDPYGNLILTIN